MSAPEWSAAWARGSFLHGYSTARLDPRPDYRMLDFSARPARANAPFERTLDLFGDGSLILAATPGHSVGHLSLVLGLGTREALLTGDAAYTMATLRERRRPRRSEDPKAFEQSLRRLQAYDRQHPEALVIVGHEMPAWEGLAELYS